MVALGRPLKVWTHGGGVGRLVVVSNGHFMFTFGACYWASQCSAV